MAVIEILYCRFSPVIVDIRQLRRIIRRKGSRAEAGGQCGGYEDFRNSIAVYVILISFLFYHTQNE